MHYLSVAPLPMRAVKENEFARTRRQSGCAALTFKLDMDGKPRDIKILREIPVGGGYGDAAIEDLRQSKFNPPLSRDALYYLATSVVFNAGPTIPPYPAVTPAAPALKTTQAQNPRGEAVSGLHAAG